LEIMEERVTILWKDVGSMPEREISVWPQERMCFLVWNLRIDPVPGGGRVDQIKIMRDLRHVSDRPHTHPPGPRPGGLLRATVTSDTRGRGHGRRERRTLKITAVAAGLAFSHAAQAVQIVRRRRSLTSKKWATETVYAITSLTAAQASPAQLAAALRGHWAIEDRLHWVRDVTYGEDHSQVRTTNGPRNCGNSPCCSVNRRPGHQHPAPDRSHQHRSALRHHSRRPHRPLQTLMTA
jgi:predicted transposase YbfD/YdcC